MRDTSAALVGHSLADGVALLTLDDPSRRNVLSRPMVRAIVDAVEACEDDPEVHAVVLTGAGAAFCAGADLSDLLAVTEGEAAVLEEIYEGFLRVADCSLPTVAAVNGPAVGAGFNLALACDLRIVGPRARFECRFGELGLHPGGGHTWLLRNAVNDQRAAAMLLFGQSIDAEEATRVGLAYASAPTDAVLVEEAIAVARRAARVPVDVLRLTKETLRAAATAEDHATCLALERERQLASMRTPEFLARVSRLKAGISRRPAEEAPTASS